MQDLDDNIDELFRKAGGGYPLKTDTTGWDKIEQMLSEKPALHNIPKKRNSKKKYGALIILLLAFFLFGTLTSRYIWERDTVAAGNPKNPVSSANDAATKSLKPVSTANQSLAIQHKTTAKRQVVNKRGDVATSFVIQDLNKILSTAINDDLDAERNAAQPETTQPSQQVKSIANLNTEKPDWHSAGVLQRDNDMLFNKPAVPSVKGDIDNIHATTNGTPIIEKAKMAKSNQPHGKFYVGALAGISLNRVKNQGLQKPGYDVGLMAGYQLTKQLS